MPWTSGRTNTALAALVVEAYGWDCWLCGLSIDPALPRTHRQGLSLDHVRPRSRGGLDSVRNLRPAHLVCNLRRGARTPKPARADVVAPELGFLTSMHPLSPPPAGDSHSNNPEKPEEYPK